MIEPLLIALQDPLTWVEIFAAGCGLTGSLVMALKGANAHRGWLLFALSNIGWLAFSFSHAHWFFFVQQIGFSITSAIGIWKWLVEPAIERRRLHAFRHVVKL